MNPSSSYNKISLADRQTDEAIIEETDNVRDLTERLLLHILWRLVFTLLKIYNVKFERNFLLMKNYSYTLGACANGATVKLQNHFAERSNC